jgi:hypothetical protein
MNNFQYYQFDPHLRRDRGGFARDPLHAGSAYLGPDRSWKAEFTRVYKGLADYLRPTQEVHCEQES